MGSLIQAERLATIRRIVPEALSFKIVKSSEAYAMLRRRGIWYETPNKTVLDPTRVLLRVSTLDRWVVVRVDEKKSRTEKPAVVTGRASTVTPGVKAIQAVPSKGSTDHDL